MPGYAKEFLPNGSEEQQKEFERRVREMDPGNMSELSAAMLVAKEMREEKAEGGRMGYGAGGIIAGWVAKQLVKKTAKPVTQKSIDFSSNAIVKRLDNYNIKPDDIVSEDQLLKVLDSVKQAETNVFNNKFGNIIEQGMEGISKLKKADGGRAGYYGGGQAMVGEDLSEIGHGSDSLMARNMQLAPNSMATTSTGLNYLLGQDNDTARVPYKDAGPVILPKPKPKNFSRTLDMLNTQAAANSLDTKTYVNLVGEFAKKAFDNGELSEVEYMEIIQPLFGEVGEMVTNKIQDNQNYLEKYADGGRIGFGKGKFVLDGIMNLFKKKPKKLETVKDFVPEPDTIYGVGGKKIKLEDLRIKHGLDKETLKKADDALDIKLQEILAKNSTKHADGGRIGYASKGDVSLLDFIKVNASGSKSGKNKIQGAPEGITVDNQTINAIINLDIPINEKINILGSYAYGKGRNKIEKGDEEIFLGEGGYKDRNIGLGFNQGGEGLSGSVIRNLETGDDDVQIKFLKKFSKGGIAGILGK